MVNVLQLDVLKTVLVQSMARRKNYSCHRHSKSHFEIRIYLNTPNIAHRFGFFFLSQAIFVFCMRCSSNSRHCIAFKSKDVMVWPIDGGGLAISSHTFSTNETTEYITYRQTVYFNFHMNYTFKFFLRLRSSNKIMKINLRFF